MPHPTKAGTSKLSISFNEIHLWMTRPQDLLNIQENIQLKESYQAVLTPEETKKQQRYKFAKDRHDALITRVFVRDLLSKYVDIAPSDWHFDKGEKDKPEVMNCPLPLRFNLSHTKNLIICAVTLVNDIGCDVENTTRNNDVLAIADRYFSSTEIDQLFTLPKEHQRHRFFDYWTLKESYIKAWGLGLAIPLKDFSFTIGKAKTEDMPTSMNSNIQVNFAQHRVDTPEIWRNWLFYPNDEHRIALSIRAKENNQKTDYKLRFFNSIPLVDFTELKSITSII